MSLKRKIRKQFLEKQAGRNGSKPRILIAMSVSEGITTDTHQCLINLFHSSMKAGLDYAFYVHQSANVHLSRNTCVLRAYDYKCTHIMFIDSDMIFPDGLKGGMPSIIQQLLARDKDIVGAICVRRKVPCQPTIANLNREKGYYVNIYEWPEDKLIEVDAIGTALLMVKIGVFDKISEKFFPDIPRENHNWFGHITLRKELGSDYSFCYRAQEVGFKVHCDTAIPTGHIGKYVYTLNDFNAFKKELIEKTTEREIFTKARLAEGEKIEEIKNEQRDTGDSNGEKGAVDNYKESGEQRPSMC